MRLNLQGGHPALQHTAELRAGRAVEGGRRGRGLAAAGPRRAAGGAD